MTIVYKKQEERNLMKACMEHLRSYVPDLKIEVTLVEPDDSGIDFNLRVGNSKKMAGFLKGQSHLSRDQVHHIILRAHEWGRRTLGEVIVFARWIPDSWAEAFRKAQSVEYVRIHFVDSLGNAFIQMIEPRIRVDVRGRRPEKPPLADPGRLIEPSGLKVIHTLLTQDDAIGMPFRRIAERSGVSLRTVAIVMSELERAGYLVPMSRATRRLDRKADLIEHFVRGYGFKLRPSILLGRFRHTNTDAEKLRDRVGGLYINRAPAGENCTGVLTGALAEGGIAPSKHLLADSLVMFVKPWAREALLKDERMLPDEDTGNVTLLDWFAPSVQAPGPQVYDMPFATDLLVYAELLHDGRPRELEAADLLRKRRLEIARP